MLNCQIKHICNFRIDRLNNGIRGRQWGHEDKFGSLHLGFFLKEHIPYNVLFCTHKFSLLYKKN